MCIREPCVLQYARSTACSSLSVCSHAGSGTETTPDTGIRFQIVFFFIRNPSFIEYCGKVYTTDLPCRYSITYLSWLVNA